MSYPTPCCTPKAHTSGVLRAMFAMFAMKLTANGACVRFGVCVWFRFGLCVSLKLGVPLSPLVPASTPASKVTGVKYQSDPVYLGCDVQTLLAAMFAGISREGCSRRS